MVSKKACRTPSDYSLQIWTLVARRGMSLANAARQMDTSLWRAERIVLGVSRRHTHRWI